MNRINLFCVAAAIMTFVSVQAQNKIILNVDQSNQVISKHDYNSFDKPDAVSVKDFKEAKLSNGKLVVDLPGKSVVMLEIE